MAVTMSFEKLGQLVIAKGATVPVSWELFPDEFPPLINHTVIFGFDNADHVVRVSTVDHFGRVGNFSAMFRYFVTNISAGPAQVVTSMHYIFFKAN